MKDRTKVRYFSFPVELLKGAFTNIAGVCSDAIDYAVYGRCKDYDETPEEVFKFFGITGNTNAVFTRGEELYNSFDRPVLVSVNRAIVFDFMENPKTDFEVAIFCAFCGLRSIIGKKPFVKTNNGLLIARMFGYATAKEFEALRQKPNYYKEFFWVKDKGKLKEKIRYQLTEKIIKNELALKWGLRYYSNRSKGFYASFKLDFEELVFHAEKSRKSNLLKQQQKEQRQIIERVRKYIGGK
jgi:hypothetical protein